MAKKSLIYREKKRQKLEKKYHLIRRSSKKEISKIPSLSDAPPPPPVKPNHIEPTEPKPLEFWYRSMVRNHFL
jgi:hypothetical protein